MNEDRLHKTSDNNSVGYIKLKRTMMHRWRSGVGAATDSIGNFWTLEYILPPHPGRTYSRVRHTRAGRTLEYVLPGEYILPKSWWTLEYVLPRVRGDCHTASHLVFFLCMIRYNNVLRPVHDPPCQPTTPAQKLGSRDIPGPQPLRIDAYDLGVELANHPQIRPQSNMQGIS